MIYKKILCVCSNEYQYFFNKRNVVGVGLGYKITNGFCKFIPCIKVLVSTKIPPNEIPPNESIPEHFKGLITDVVQSGNISASSLTTKARPVLGGYSIGPSSGIRSGSMACLVTDGKHYYILSNNHVLVYGNVLPIGTPVLQPGIEDGGQPLDDKVATLSKYAQLKFITHKETPTNYIDCALAQVNDKSLVSSKLAIIGSIKGITSPVLGESVKKVGRSTGLTTGKILSIGSTVSVNFKAGKCLFKNQITTTKMAEAGDSGSLLVNSSHHAVGLLFSGADSASCFNPINTVLDSLKVSIVTSH
ncbi:hypothetical protein [Clostridium botulinum]|nr:hypothetical protein [Clostridium botulinum]AEB75716.1 conserved hypothetical protein [Clostridium botulinum BKT015925]